MLIAQISDMHVKAEGELLYRRIDTAGFLERAVAHVNALDPQPDIVLATGDLVDGGKPEEYAHLRRLLAPLAMPVHLIPGNHDARDVLREVFPDHTYLPPTGFLQYAIEGLPVRLIALDTLVPGKGYGELCAERLGWLEARLGESDRPTILFMHHPPFDCGIAVFDDTRLMRGEPQLAALVRRHGNVERVMCGHVPPDPGALGGHHGLDRAQHGAPGNARPARQGAAVDDDGASWPCASPVAPGHRSGHARELHRNL
jgi:3',5'-cyclic AMP phosphodiesterase CpdA